MAITMTPAPRSVCQVAWHCGKNVGSTIGPTTGGSDVTSGPRKQALEALGRRVARLRTERGWTQQRLADRLALSRTAVSHIEADLSQPSERTVIVLAGLFRLEPTELVEGTLYPQAKAERLPPVGARYTEVEHRLGVLEAELAHVVALNGPARVEFVRRWQPILERLGANALDADEAALVRCAARRLSAVQ